MTYARDVFFRHTVCVEVDPALANDIGEEHLLGKAEDLLEDDVGPAAKWFEHDETDGTDVAFELRVGTAHQQEPTDDEAIQEAKEYAQEKFEDAGSVYDVDDLELLGVVDPDDPIDELTDTDDDTGTGTVTVTDTDTGNDNAGVAETDEREISMAEAMAGDAP